MGFHPYIWFSLIRVLPKLLQIQLNCVRARGCEADECILHTDTSHIHGLSAACGPKQGWGLPWDREHEPNLRSHRDTWLLRVALCGSQVQDNHLRPRSTEDTSVAAPCSAAGPCHPQCMCAPWGDTAPALNLHCSEMLQSKYKSFLHIPSSSIL